MSQPPATGAVRADVPIDPRNASTGQLVGDLTEQITTLVRSEVQLATVEMKQKAKRYGIGAGLFGGAGFFGLLGANAVVTAIILALADVLPGWAAGLIVAVVLFFLAAVLALLGKKDVQKAGRPVPTEALAGLQADVDTVKHGISR